MMGLTHRQRDALEFIRAKLETDGISPSYDEIADFLGLKSRHTILNIVDRLVAAGLLKKIFGRKRALELRETENYHRPDCNCDGCAQTRYFEQLKLVKALKVDPPVAITKVRLDNIRLLDSVTRAELLGNPNIAAPRTRKTALPQGAC